MTSTVEQVQAAERWLLADRPTDYLIDRIQTAQLAWMEEKGRREDAETLCWRFAVAAFIAVVATVCCVVRLVSGAGCGT